MLTNKEWLLTLLLVIFEFFLFFMMYWNHGYKMSKCFIYAIITVVALMSILVFGILLLHVITSFC